MIEHRYIIPKTKSVERTLFKKDYVIGSNIFQLSLFFSIVIIPLILIFFSRKKHGIFKFN